MLKIKNITLAPLKLHLKYFNVGEVFILENKEDVKDWATQEVIDSIGINIEIYYNDNLLSPNTAIAYLKKEFNSSAAIDKNGLNQQISNEQWYTINGNRKLWDYGSNFNITSSAFIAPFDGIYFCDGQFKIENIINCTAIELAVFCEDDYWFILDKKNISDETEIQLSAATLFDMRENQGFTIKIKLYGDNASAVISGDDDFTAWGYDFEKPLYGE